MDNKTRIENLLQTSEFKELLVLAEKLNSENKKFDLLSVFDKLINENAWSRFFAYLLDSQGDHDLEQQVFRKWLDKNNSCNSVSEFINKCPSKDETVITTITEWRTDTNRKLDILIKLQDLRGNTVAVVGIENKLYSAELTDQVCDYQNSLNNTFPNVPKILFFLTPNGRESLTAAQTAACPCIPSSYKLLRDVFNEIIDAGGAGHAVVLLSVITNHLNRLIKSTNMEREIRDLVRSLYEKKEHRQALKLINRYLPSTMEVLEGVKKIIKDSYSENNKTDTYGENEFKLFDSDLDGLCEYKGITPCFMLLSETKSPDIGDKFVFRLMLHYDNKTSKPFNEMRDIIFEQACLPNSLGTPKHSWQWINIWVGGTYQLVDLGEKDIVGLEKLLNEGIQEIKEQLKARLKIISKSNLI